MPSPLTLSMAALTVFLVPALALARCEAAVAAPIPPPPIASVSGPSDGSYLDGPTRRILELQRQIAEAEAEQIAIDARIAVTSRHIIDQTARLDRANENLRLAQSAFDERAVAIYKSDERDALALLLDARSFQDLITRISVLRRVLDLDRLTLEEAALVAAQAQDEAGQLEELRAHDVELRTIKEETSRIVQLSLAEEQGLLSTLSAGSRVIVDTQAREYRSTRAHWKAASIPLGTVIRTVAGIVLDYPDRTYRVSQYHYTRYRTTGISYRAVCSWYGADFNGRGTASGQVYNMSDFTCAHKTLPFGTWLALTRYDSKSRTYRHIIVVVNDRGPYIPGRDIDLSKAAAEALGIAGAGVANVSVEVVTPVR